MPIAKQTVKIWHPDSHPSKTLLVQNIVTMHAVRILSLAGCGDRHTPVVHYFMVRKLSIPSFCQVLYKATNNILKLYTDMEFLAATEGGQLRDQ